MAEDSDKKEDAGTPQADAFAVFDKVFELRWVVKICAVVLFAETALMLVKGASFYSFEWARANWVSETGNLVWVAVALGLTVSAVLPLLEAMISFGVLRIRSLVVNDREIGHKDLVKLEQLREKADREQSEYLLAKVKARESHVKRRIRSMEKAGNASFQCLALFLANHYVGQLGTQSSIQHILSTPYRSWAIVFLLCVGLILLTMCLISWWRDYSPTIWIKDAELYKELRMKEKESLPKFADR